MRNLSKDIKGRRPVLINPTIATGFLERAASLNIPLIAKAADMDEMLTAIFGPKPVLEKFPPFALVPLRGVIGKGLSELEARCGCCDLNAIEEMLEDCERDSSITTVIISINSPGGTSVGVPELASRIREMSKKVISFTDSEACSAAYWLGSQATEFYATPSSSVGSVGCFIAYEDESKRYADEGVVVDVIRAGKYKGAGIAGTALSADQREMLQAEVVEIWEGFKADVKSVREFVDDSSLEAQIYSGKRASELGLVTGLVRGFDELMETLAPEVAVQIEADESNDERVEGGENDEEAKALSRFASARALGRGLLKVLAAKSAKSEDDEEDDEEDKDKSEPASETEDEEKKDEEKSEDPDEKKKDEDPAAEDDEEKKDEEKSEDSEKDEKDEEPVSSEDGEEKKDEEEKSEDPADGEENKGQPAQPSAEDDEEEKEKDDDKIDDEAESGDGAVDTDDKHNRKGSKRSKGRVA